MVKVAIAGGAGRMGKVISRIIIEECDDWEITGSFETEGSPFIGRDAGETAGCGPIGVEIISDSASAMEGSSVLIDFTSSEASSSHINVAAAQGVSAVIGSTGFNAAQKREVKEAAARIPIVLAPNMSVGVNLLFKIVGDVASILGKDFDVEISEIHHRFKKDAPSGTAVRIGEIVSESLGLSLEQNGVFGRKGLVGERGQDEVGIMTLRAGDVVGEHTVIFGGIGERLEITHRAHTRETFARGAIRAARWVLTKEKGLYDMQDVLGLTDGERK